MRIERGGAVWGLAWQLQDEKSQQGNTATSFTEFLESFLKKNFFQSKEEN